MGKPASRLGDLSMHGGTMMGPGCPTVMIGKMPAITLGDMHVCPMCNGPVPHVGGPVTLGSMGVFLGKKPAVRISDLCVCVGPPSQAAMGCMTVFIGEAGGAGGGGGGPIADASVPAVSAGKKAEAFPAIPPPQQPPEVHEVKFSFVDGAKKPLAGVTYRYQGPDHQVLRGVSDDQGQGILQTLAQAGSYDVEVKQFANAKWPKQRLMLGEEITLQVDADGFEDGETGIFAVMSRTNGAGQNFIAHLPFSIQGKKAKAKWKVSLSGQPPDPKPAPGAAPKQKTYHFIAYSSGAMIVSGPATLDSKLVVHHVDVVQRPITSRVARATLADGRVLERSLDAHGKADFGEVPVGTHKVELAPPVLQAASDAEVGAYLDTQTVIRKGCRDEEGEKRNKQPGKIRIRGNQVFDLQNDLIALGFDEAGDPDGDLTKKWVEAIQTFQQAAKGPYRLKGDQSLQVTPDYTGDAHGAVDTPTKTQIKKWKNEGWKFTDDYVDGTLSLADCQEIALKISAHYEGAGYVNTTGNFDGQGLSFGIIQWNFGAKTLPPLLREMRDVQQGELLRSCFEDQNLYPIFLSIIEEGQSVERQKEWALSIQTKTEVTSKGKTRTKWTLQEPWKTILKNIGNISEFQQIQKKTALKDYGAKTKKMIDWLRHKYPAPFEKITARTYCGFFDLAVQQNTFIYPKGNKAQIRDEILEAVKKLSQPTQKNISKIVFTIRASYAKDKFKATTESRRLSVLEAKGVKVVKTIGSKTYQASRPNPHFNLLHPNKLVEGL